MNHGLTNVIVKLLKREMLKPRTSREGTVYLPAVLLWVGIVCTALFLIPGLIVPLATGSWETWPFLIFAGMGASLIVGHINCRIWYNEDGFVVKYFLGYRRRFSYSEIESIQGWQRDVKLKVRGCTVRVDEAAVGKWEFLDFARKKYRIHSGGKAIPVVRKSKWDPFNGHVDNPGEFVFAYLLLLVFMPGAMLVCWLVTEPTPMEEMTFVTAEVVWTKPAEDDKTDLVLYAGGTEMEIWGYKNTLSDPDAFLIGCKNREIFTIGYRTVTNDEDEITGFIAEYIQDSSGKIWITPEIAKNNRFWEVAVIFGVLELIWLAFCGASIYVGRNPHKFSKKTVRLFFKDGYVH